MTGKKKMQQDKRAWERMGRELAALRDMIGNISTDREYQAIMDRRTLDKLRKAQEWVDKVRSDAESRMALFIPDWDTQTFYPHDRQDLNAAISEFRDRMKKTPASIRSAGGGKVERIEYSTSNYSRKRRKRKYES